MLPCPFCGSTDLSDNDGFIYCLTCDASAPTGNWNQRTFLAREPIPEYKSLSNDKFASIEKAAPSVAPDDLCTPVINPEDPKNSG